MSASHTKHVGVSVVHFDGEVMSIALCIGTHTIDYVTPQIEHIRYAYERNREATPRSLAELYSDVRGCGYGTATKKKLKSVSHIANEILDQIDAYGQTCSDSLYVCGGFEDLFLLRSFGYEPHPYIRMYSPRGFQNIKFSTIVLGGVVRHADNGSVYFSNVPDEKRIEIHNNAMAMACFSKNELLLKEYMENKYDDGLTPLFPMTVYPDAIDWVF